jgi:ribosomal protein S18 acetylase RimI-like enzyme
MDDDEIATVFALGCQYAYTSFFPTSLIQRYNPTTQRDRWRTHRTSLSPKHKILVAATDHSSVVGFVEVGPATDPKLGEVHYLFVHPDHLRLGIGAALLRAAEHSLERDGYTIAVLWVFTKNETAMKFYEKLGWSVYGEERTESTLASQGFYTQEIEMRKTVG